MTEPLSVTRDGHVAVLTIDRPEKRNAMTAAMWAALPGLLGDLADDDAVRVLVVTGAGPSFCAGADIADLLGADPASHQGGGRGAQRGSRRPSPSGACPRFRWPL